MVAIETILSSSSDMNQSHKHTLQPDHTLISTKDEKSLTKVDEIKKKKQQKLTNFKGSVWRKLLELFHNNISLNKSQLQETKQKTA